MDFWSWALDDRWCEQVAVHLVHRTEMQLCRNSRFAESFPTEVPQTVLGSALDDPVLEPCTTGTGGKCRRVLQVVSIPTSHRRPTPLEKRLSLRHTADSNMSGRPATPKHLPRCKAFGSWRRTWHPAAPLSTPKPGINVERVGLGVAQKFYKNCLAGHGWR